MTCIDKSEGTAFCPLCGIDSVIGDASGIPITQEFLTAMHDKWFGGSEGEPDPNDPLVIAFAKAMPGTNNDHS